MGNLNTLIYTRDNINRLAPIEEKFNQYATFLFAYTCQTNEIGKQTVYGRVRPDRYLEEYKIDYVEIHVVKTDFFLDQICAPSFDAIYFFGSGFNGRDIHYALSRMRINKLKGIERWERK